MIALDLLHLWHLGCCRDLVGSGFKLMVRKKGLYFSAPNIAGRLRQLTAEIREFAKACGKSVSFKKMTKNTLKWKNTQCPELHASGADAGVCLSYLVEKLQAQDMRDPYSGLFGCCWCAHTMVRLLMSAGFFLSEEERDAIYTVGAAYQVSYAQLAAVCISWRAAFQDTAQVAPTLPFTGRCLA